MNKMEQDAQGAEVNAADAQGETVLNKMNKMDEREQKPSASGLQRLIACPGSWLASLACPQDEASADAAMGTRLHAHMENGTTPEDADEAEACEWCREMGARWARELVGEDATEIEEVRWWSRDRDFSGKVDRVYYNSETGTALVIDYKFGRGEVEPEKSNMQLAGYALLAVDNLPHVVTVYVGILQPYVSRAEKLPRRWNADEADALRAYISQAIQAAQQPGAELRPGESQCKYCPALATCPAMKLTVQKLSSAEDVLARWDALTPAVKRQAWDLAKLGAKWCKAVEEKTRATLLAGQEVDGLGLKPGAKCLQVKDAAKAFALVQKEYPEAVTPEAFVACCSVAIGKLDDLLTPAMKARDASLTVDACKARARAILAPVSSIRQNESSVTKLETAKKK